MPCYVIICSSQEAILPELFTFKLEWNGDRSTSKFEIQVSAEGQEALKTNMSLPNTIGAVIQHRMRELAIKYGAQK